ncbi:MAG: Clp protease N-terminal domain-containing protein [Actinomycetota bacterium]|nr:hypothetical protein [Actinomycetota bacterium]
MFERFTDRARKVVVLATSEAHRLHQSAARPEHLLLGVLEEGQSLAAIALRANGVEKESVSLPLLEDGTLDQGDEGFTEEAWDTLRSAIALSQTHSHEFIAPEHILLALYETGHSARDLLDRHEDVQHTVLATITDAKAMKEGKICSRCGASAVTSGKVEELSLPVEDRDNINLFAYYCGECKSTFGLVRGDH